MPSLIPLLEAAAADLLEDFAISLSQRRPELGVECRRFGLAVACAAGPENPLSTVKALGPALPAGTLDELEAFFESKGVPPALELAPWMEPEAWELLTARGYVVAAEEDVMLRATGQAGEGVAETVENDEEWARLLSVVFWGEEAERWVDLGLALARMPAVDLFGLRVDGQLAAVAQLVRGLRVATFAGDGTLQAYRGQGLQRRLIEARLARAAKMQIPWCVSEVAPQSGSQRNYERCGFTKIYTRQHWKKAAVFEPAPDILPHE
jgi:GNAT superfamily N-acetyltransferase